MYEKNDTNSIIYILTFSLMFRWRIISRSNVNGKVHTFQKDFDDYDTYQEFIGQNPEYSPRGFLENFWNPWGSLERYLPNYEDTRTLPADTRHLPEGVDLDKYEKRRLEKRQSEAEKLQKKQSLERSEVYLKDYLEENPDDQDAKSDLEKIQKELKTFA